jgi:alkanesulfonate monooxygenase SsuD/methylene tetrahydromethanopterin reductase-like flavin-dependent oxidoreductase (luciferase family)
MEGEFANLGADFAARGRLLDEWLELALAVFEQMPGHVRFAGELLEVDGWMAPALVRPGGPELWVAGVSRATLRRAAKTGVWHPVALPPDELRAMAADFRERRPDGRVILRIGAYLSPEAQTGADERGRHALEGPPDWIAERLAEYVDAGSDGFVINVGHELAGVDERIQRFGEEVLPLLRG